MKDYFYGLFRIFRILGFGIMLGEDCMLKVGLVEFEISFII